MNTSQLLKALMKLFDGSTVAYRQYLAAGKTFQFAQELKLHNSKALQLLFDNKKSMPEELQEDIQSLITHYTEWSQKWDHLAAEKEHKPDDVFVFSNDVTFPKQAAQNLEAAYRKIN